ncbi:MAG: transcriptional repressor [Candidatus Bipolaricaulia bacterium]
MERLRDVGIGPTVQRMAILEFLERTRSHPTADEVYSEIQKAYPTISRATVYNTLDALTKAGMILKLSVDPTVARYDADLDPHAHFRCRVCNKVYDIPVGEMRPLGKETNGHLVESVLTYAFGVCAACLKDNSLSEDKQQKKPQASSTPPGPNQEEAHNA